MPTSAGTGAGASGCASGFFIRESGDRWSTPKVGRAAREVEIGPAYSNCHLTIFRVSPRRPLTPSAVVVSNPECIMQFSHLGSLPGP